MSDKTAMQLSTSRTGRIILHLTAIKRNGHVIHHFQGIKREVLECSAPILITGMGIWQTLIVTLSMLILQ